MEHSEQQHENFELESIFGPDDRSIDQDIANKLWRPVCAIYHSFGEPGKSYIGTGVLVGRRTVFTAAHNVFRLGTKTKITSGRVSVGVKGGKAAASARVINFKIPKTYVAASVQGSGKYAHDYAVLHLDTDAPSTWAQTHWPLDRMRLIEDRDFKNEGLTLAGFPAESKSGKVDLHVGSGKALNWTANPRVFSYKIDTTAGQSGAPVFSLDRASGALRVAGVHVAGIDGSHNLANRLTNVVRDKVLGWVSDFENRS